MTRGQHSTAKEKFHRVNPIYYFEIYALFATGCCKMIFSFRRNREGIHEPEANDCHFDDGRRAGVCAGAKADQGGRPEGLRNNQRQ
jgi:hypothetical protein